MRSITNRSSSDRTTEIRRRAEWLSRGSIRNAYTATQESHTSNIAGRVAAAIDGCCTVQVDDDIFSIGVFYNTVPVPFLDIYDSNNMVDISMSSISVNRNSIFLIKYDKTGQPQWAAKMGDATDNSVLPSLVADTNGDIYVTWLQTGTQLELYNASSSVPSISMTLDSRRRKIIVAKYSNSGQVQWGTYISSAQFSLGLTNVVVNTPTVSIDSNHNVHLNVDYDVSGELLCIYQASNAVAPIKTYSATANGYDSILIKYDTNGTFLWAANVGSDNTEVSSTIACDKDNNVYIAGSYASNPLLIYNSDNSLSSITLSNAGTYDNYLIKYNSNGFAQWGVHIGGTIAEFKQGICIDSDGFIYITGGYNSSSVNIYDYNNITPSFTLSSTAFYDTYLVKYDTNGVSQWATKIGGNQREYYPSLSCDSNKNIIISGINRTVDVGISSILCYNKNNLSSPALIITPNILGPANSCVFVVSYNTNGILNWGTRIENTNIAFIYPIVTVDQSGNIYVTSEFGANTTLQIYDAGGITSVRTLTGGTASRSTFIVKYSNTGVSEWASKIVQYTFNPSISTPFKAAF
jgi:hypothetical protein